MRERACGGQGQGNDCSSTIRRCNRDRSAVEFGDLSRDTETQAELPIPGGIEGHEYYGEFVTWNTLAVILDCKYRFLTIAGDAKLYFGGARFDRIGNDLPEHPCQLGGVAADRMRGIRIELRIDRGGHLHLHLLKRRAE